MEGDTAMSLWSDDHIDTKTWSLADRVIQVALWFIFIIAACTFILSFIGAMTCIIFFLLNVLEMAW